MSLLASNFKWDGKSGTIDREKLMRLLDNQLYECLEITSDRTGKKIVFQDFDHNGLIYVSREDPYMTIRLTKDDFPFKTMADIRGKYFVLTGTLRENRSEVLRRIDAKGGHGQITIVRNVTNYVVAAKDAITANTSKVVTARRNGISIIDGEKFMDFLDTL